MDFAVPLDLELKLKKSEMIGKYLKFAKWIKKLRNIRVMVIPISSLRIVLKALKADQKNWKSGEESTSSRLVH